jgi:hypothetical protein
VRATQGSWSLVLSFTPSAKTRIRWNQATISCALRAGTDRATRETAGGGLGGRALAFLVRELVDDPLAWFLGRP